MEKWFSEVRLWEDSDLTDGEVCFISIIGVSIPMWNVQFFSFVALDFGQFLRTFPATKHKVNLQEASLKVYCKSGAILLFEWEVCPPNSLFLVSLKVFTLECAPFRLVFGF